MDVNAGYRLTDVGVIPEDWEVVKLGDVTDIATGSTPPTHDVDNYGDEFLFVSPIDLGSSKYIKKTEKRLSAKGFNLVRQFPKNSILFVCIGSTIGKCGIAARKLTTNQQINVVLPSKDKSHEYLYYTLLAAATRIRLQAGEQAVPIVNKTLFANTLIPIPSTRSEQEAIAGALSDADALIEALGQLIAKKRQIKQGAMQALLTGQRRLPGYTEDWFQVSLGQIGQYFRGVSYEPNLDLSSTDTRSTIRLLRSNNINDARVAISDIQFVNKARVSAEQKLRRNDIVICMANGSRDLVGKSSRFDITDGYEYTFGAFMGAFRVNSAAVDSTYVSYLFHTEQYRIHILLLLAGSSINNLTPSNIESFAIDVPSSKEEQRAIAGVLSDMDAEIAALDDKLNKARQIKQGMMQELLTGRIRLTK